MQRVVRNHDKGFRFLRRWHTRIGLRDGQRPIGAKLDDDVHGIAQTPRIACENANNQIGRYRQKQQFIDEVPVIRANQTNHIAINFNVEIAVCDTTRDLNRRQRILRVNRHFTQPERYNVAVGIEGEGYRILAKPEHLIDP